MSDHKRLQFEQTARAWAAKTGASVWICDHGGSVSVRIDNPPSGFGVAYSPEEFFRRIGGKFTEAPPQRAVPVSPPPLRFSVQQYRDAHKAYGANCGYCAMAAVLGITLDEVRRLVPNAEKAGGIHRDVMEDAICRAGWSCRQVGANLPSYGLAVIAFGKDQAHWVAVSGSKILDSCSTAMRSGLFGRVNWCDAGRWWREIAPKVAEYFPRTNGEWWVDYGIEVER